MNFFRHRIAALFAIDVRTLALFRVLLGTILCVDALQRMGDARAFYSDSGVMPRDWLVTFNGPWRISLYMANGTTAFAVTLLTLEAAAAAMLALGWRTRFAVVSCFVLEASLLNRNILVLIGGDILLLCLLFWSLFLPLAARFSVDAALSSSPPREPTHLSWASAGLLLQVMSVYFFSGYLKSGREWWPDGSAVYYALALDHYALPFGVWLNHFLWLTTALTYFVLFLQRWGSLLVFSPFFNRPLRLAMDLLFMGMHLAFIFCLALGPFPYISLASLTTLIGGWIWDAADRRLQRRESRHGDHPLRIYYDRDCGFCLKSCLLFKTFLVLPRAIVAPAQDHARAKALLEANYSWVVIDHDDRAHLKWPAFVCLLRRSPLFFWLGALLDPRGPARRLVAAGNAVYDFVGRHRGAFGALSERLLPWREPRFEVNPAALGLFGATFAGCILWHLWLTMAPLRLGLAGAAWIFGFALAVLLVAGAIVLGRHPRARRIAVQSCAACMVFVVLAWNLCTLHWLPNRLYAWLTPPFLLLRLDQIWDMFAPFPSKEDGWYVIPGRLADGNQLDLLHPDRAGVDYAKPRHIALTFPNIRWHKYLENLWAARFADNRPYFGDYLCREWNRSHPPPRQLESLKIVYMLEMTPPPGQTPQVEQRVLLNHTCPGPQPGAYAHG
ncbi:MAG: HTTM domain-containing protein [Sinobacteraceae bacterium]|nr:HTTM domain-containing protein [Nevskiaceae bacterium]